MVITLLLCGLANAQFVDGPPDVQTNQPSKMDSDSISQQIAKGETQSGLIQSAVTADTPIGSINLPAGSQVNINQGSLTTSRLTSAKTSSNINVIDCSTATIAKNGRFTATTCDYLTVGPLRFKNVKNIVASADSLTFSSADSGSSTAPTFTQYPALGQSTFTLSNNKLLTSDLTFTSSIPFSYSNPLAFDSGKFNSYTPVDSDGDGLVDSVEEKIGTNINSKDSDGDSLSDADEFLLYATNGTNAHTYSGAQAVNPEFTTDPEFVSWTNSNFDRISGTLRIAFERSGINASPVWRDSDGDAVSDFKEAIYFNTNPRTADSDADGWTDGEEIANGWNPKDLNSPPKINYNQIQCKDCIVTVRPQVGGSLRADFSNYSTNGPGAKVSYQFKKTELAIQSNNILSAIATDVNTFTINDSKESASIFFEKQQNFYQTTTQNIVSRLDGFKILEPATMEADYYEILAGSNVRYLWHPVDGVVETELSSPGLYQYQFKNNWMTGPYSFSTKSWGQSFSLHRPQLTGLGTATIVFDKPSRFMTRDQFEQTYAKSSVEASYVSFPSHQMKLKGVLTYSRPQVQVLGILPLADAYQEGSIAVADITYRDDNIISVSPAITTGVQLPAGNVGFERISSTSGRLLFKVPASLVKVAGNPHDYSPVWKSNDPNLNVEVTLDPTNILASLVLNESTLTNGQRYDVWFDDTHIFGGMENTTLYRFGGFSDQLGSGALASFELGSTIISRDTADVQSPVIQRTTFGNVSFVSTFDDATKKLNATVTTYFAKSDKSSCGVFDASGLPQKSDLGKTILGFLVSISPIIIFIPRRYVRKGQVSIIILIALVVIMITIAAVYLSPSWSDVMKNTVLKITNVESDSALTKEYAQSCYATATRCWLQRSGLNNGHLQFPPSKTLGKTEGENYIAAAGASCVDQYDFTGRTFNMKAAKATVELGFNAEDTSAQVSQKIQLKFISASSTARAFFAQEQVRYQTIATVAARAQATNTLRGDPRNVDLLVLGAAPFATTVFDLGKHVLVDMVDPQSSIVPDVRYHWMWIGPAE